MIYKKKLILFGKNQNPIELKNYRYICMIIIKKIFFDINYIEIIYSGLFK